MTVHLPLVQPEELPQFIEQGFLALVGTTLVKDLDVGSATMISLNTRQHISARAYDGSIGNDFEMSSAVIDQGFRRAHPLDWETVESLTDCQAG